MLNFVFMLCPMPQFEAQSPLCLTAYYRGAMGILLVYDVTDEASFNNIRNWMRNIEQHASDTVNKVLLAGPDPACQHPSSKKPVLSQQFASFSPGSLIKAAGWP